MLIQAALTMLARVTLHATKGVRTGKTTDRMQCLPTSHCCRLSQAMMCIAVTLGLPGRRKGCSPAGIGTGLGGGWAGFGLGGGLPIGLGGGLPTGLGGGLLTGLGGGLALGLGGGLALGVGGGLALGLGGGLETGLCTTISSRWSECVRLATSRYSTPC